MAYKDKYQSYIDYTLKDIQNRKPFSYNFNADPIYQQYANQYTKLGNNAMQNTIAQASTMTGGYGNSYGVTAGMQANQEYLDRLNNVIPELYNSAYNRYKDAGADLQAKLSMYQGLSDAGYQRYRDSVSDSQWQKQFDLSKAQFNYQKSQDKAKANTTQVNPYLTTTADYIYDLYLKQGKAGAGMSINSDAYKKQFGMYSNAVTNYLDNIVSRGKLTEEEAKAIYDRYVKGKAYDGYSVDYKYRG